MSIFFLSIFFLIGNAKAQFKDFSITEQGDTVNITDKKGLKQGNCIVQVIASRGEEVYEEEGFFKKNKKEGARRIYG